MPKRKSKLHPCQQMHVDDNGIVRFRENAIVRFLLDSGSINMNHIAAIPFSPEDRMQFAQLIGYSFGGYSELSYVSNESYAQAAELNAELEPKAIKIKAKQKATGTH